MYYRTKRVMHETKGWPESYGFHIHGDGPAYVIDISRGGVAHAAGLKPGDMLLEVDGHNVTDMSAEAITTLARHSRSLPPTLGVVSRVKVINLIANKKWGYGFTVKGRHPVEVASVDPPGPAYQAGLRSGDIILKVNGVHVSNDGLVTHVLQARVGRLTLSLVPIETPGSLSYLNQTQNGLSWTNGTQMEGMGPARRAKELCQKLDVVLGQSYDKKMAAIGLLKQYAEDRDVDGLVDALSGLLITDQELSLVPVLRSLVPVQHKSCFDHLISVAESDANFEHFDVSASNNSSSMTGEASGGKYTAESRFVRVKRGKGSFGFILRGHSPVTVESTVLAGPADRAGIMPGDAIIGLNGLDVRTLTHTKMVELLRGSGRSPTLEILRMEKDSAVSMNNSGSFLYTSDTDSLLKPSETMTDPSSTLDLKGGESLSEYVHLLLSPKEALATSTALQAYKHHGRISELISSLNDVLDTPPKRTLWYHIIARLPWHHQIQILKVSNALGLQSKELEKHMKERRHAHHVTDDGQDTDVSVGSFKKQLDYLLTLSERSQLKRALEEYIRSKDVHHLVYSLQQFLDTPSKRTLFFYIIPLLNAKHQSTCQNILGLPKHFTEEGRRQQNLKRDNDQGKWQLRSHSRRPQTVLSDESERESSLSSGDNDDSFSQRDTLPLRDARSPGFLLGPRNLDRGLRSHGAMVDREEIEVADQSRTKRKGRVRIVKESASQTTPLATPSRKHMTNYKTVIQVLESPSFSPSGQLRPFPGHGQLHGVNISRPYRGDTSPNTQHVGLSPNINHTQLASPNINHSYDHDPEYYVENVKVGSTNQNGSKSHHVPASANHHVSGLHRDMLLEYAHATESHVKSNVDATGITGKLIQWPPTRTRPNGVSSADSGQSRNSDDTSIDSFQRKALNAIHALDEVVANEQALPSSHIDSYLNEENVTHIGWKGGGTRGMESLPSDSMVHSPEEVSKPPPPPPPPPPVLAPIPPAPPLPPGTQLTDSVKMHVKRINWEKLDEVPEDTVWAKLSIGEELRELVEHLQLERQFTTKRSKIADSFKDRKAEMGILSPKKAYNISILLGHMKIPVREIRDALLAVDDVIMTSDLLRQLLTFAPDEKEMASYNSFTGSLEDLSKPDQFMYQITRVPNFHARLKSMLFKASFHEKVDEIKRRLDNLVKASEELQGSKSLSKLLELVLVMGNQMNKGDSRVGGAAGFRVSYLTQLDMMKTSSGKENFMNVLADVVHTRFPGVIHVATELPTLSTAVRDAEVSPSEELVEVKRMLGEIKEALKEVSEKAGAKEIDKLPTVMSIFLADATKEIDVLNDAQKDKLNRCKQMVKYFGEEPINVTLQEIFSIFLEFIHKLEKAYQQNLLTKKTFHDVSSPR